MNRRVAWAWMAALLATSLAFLVHLSLRFETVRLGYEVDEAKRQYDELIEERRLLSIEAATLRQAPRIETIAKRTLGMKKPEAKDFVELDGKRRPRRASGRAR